MGRGKEPLVYCDACHRAVPRSKAVAWVKGMAFDLGEQKDVVLDLTKKVVYYCISCAKHRKLFDKLKKRRRRFEE